MRDAQPMRNTAGLVDYPLPANHRLGTSLAVLMAHDITDFDSIRLSVCHQGNYRTLAFDHIVIGAVFVSMLLL